jgi:hypothetical protein
MADGSVWSKKKNTVLLVVRPFVGVTVDDILMKSWDAVRATRIGGCRAGYKRRTCC